MGEEFESIKRMRLEDGDIVVLTMGNVPPKQMAHAHGAIANALKQVGRKCAVLVLTPDMEITVLGKEKLEKMLAGDYKEE